MAEPIDDTHTSTTGAARFRMDGASGHLALSDDRLLDELRRNARVSTRRIRTDFVEVHTPTRVLGYVRGTRRSFIALRGDDPAWSEEIGRYPTEALAVEALRMRRA